MSRTFDAAEIATLAARKVQVIGAQETGLDQHRHQIALQFLDTVLAEMNGRDSFEWYMPATQSVTMAAGRQSYPLAGIGTSLQFIHHVYVRNGVNARDTTLGLLNREQFQEIADKGRRGDAQFAWIDHTATRKIFIWPTPGADGTARTLHLDGSGFIDDLTRSKGVVAHGMPQAWQNWMINRLACEIGDGPLIKSPLGDRDRWRAEAERMFDILSSYTNRGEHTRHPVTRPHMP